MIRTDDIVDRLMEGEIVQILPDGSQIARGPSALDIEAASEIKRLRDALRPFAAAVFDDNGDVTISTGHLRTGDWMNAKRAMKDAP